MSPLVFSDTTVVKIKVNDFLRYLKKYFMETFKIFIIRCHKVWKKNVFPMFWFSSFSRKTERKLLFFSVSVFFHEHSRISGKKENGEAIFNSSSYHFHPLQRYLGISRTITAESLPLHLGSDRTRTGYLWFPLRALKKINDTVWFLIINVHCYIIEVLEIRINDCNLVNLVNFCQ